MSSITPHEYMYNKTPLSVGDNRDENILIEALGTWIPECDLIYYGLLNSEYSDKLYKLKNTAIFNPHDIYLDTCFFSGDDLIRYLASPDDSLSELSEDFLNDATKTALDKYFYVPCNETMLRHSIIELSYYNFVKSITILYPWELREIDYQYVRNIIPTSIRSKYRLVSGDILGFLKSKNNSNIKYPTIVLNSIDDLNEMIDNNKEYKTGSSAFLLRNSSDNVSFKIEDDPENKDKKKISFDEIGTKEIFDKLMDPDKLIPKSEMRFARFEPILFSDSKPDPKDFVFGR